MDLILPLSGLLQVGQESSHRWWHSLHRMWPDMHCEERELKMRALMCTEFPIPSRVEIFRLNVTGVAKTRSGSR